MEQTLPVESKSQGLSFRGLYQVFTAPSQFFADLKNDPKILVPYIAVVLLGAIFAISMIDIISSDPNMQTEIRRAIEERGGSAQNVNIDEIVKIQGYFISSMILVMSILAPLIFALITYFWGNFIFGYKTNFKPMLSVILYSEFLFSVTGLLTLALMLAKGTMQASLSLAALFPDLRMDSMAYVLLSKISLSHIWEVIVLGIGLQYLYSIERNKGLLISVLSVGTGVIIHAFFTGLGKLFN